MAALDRCLLNVPLPWRMESPHYLSCNEMGLALRTQRDAVAQEAEVAYGGIQEHSEIRMDGRFRFRQKGGEVALEGILDR